VADDLSTYWKDLPSRETPLDARTLNEWGGSIQTVADAASLAAVESANARDEALTHVDVITAPADEQVAAYVSGTGSGATRAALDALRGRRFEALTGLSYHETRLTMGSEHNAINPASGDSAVLSGGRGLMENVIGGREGFVNNFEVSNLPADATGAYDYSVIIGGYDNVLNALASFIAGQHCLIRAEAGAGGGSGGGHHTILGGSIHEIAAGGFHAILGGTKHRIEATGNAATVVGGDSNTVGPAGQFAFAGGGKSNLASGGYAVVIGGTRNVASGQSASVVGGNDNTASGASAAVVSGRANLAGQDDSTAMGNAASPSQPGGVAFAKGQFAAVGDAQAESFVARRETTDATTATLGIAGAATAVVMPTDTAWAVRCMVVAHGVDNATNDNAAWSISTLVRRTGGAAATIVGTPSISLIASEGSASAWTVSLTTGTSPINVRVTGEAGKTIRWVARFDVAQVQG